MKMRNLMNLAIAVTLVWPVVSEAANRKNQRNQSSEKCYSRLSQMPPSVRPIVEGFLGKKAKKSFWGPVVTFGKGGQKVRDIQGMCLLSDPNGCGWKKSDEPTQILIGKNTGTFQILRDWNGDPRSRRASGYPMKICADPKNVFPVHMRFTIPKWVGNINFVTTIDAKGDWTKTPDSKVLKIATRVRKDDGPSALYAQSQMDIQPMINQYLASMAPAAPPVEQPAAQVASQPPPAPPVTSNTSSDTERAEDVEAAR